VNVTEHTNNLDFFPSQVARQEAAAEVLPMSAGSIRLGWGRAAEDTAAPVALQVKPVLV